MATPASFESDLHRFAHQNRPFFIDKKGDDLVVKPVSFFNRWKSCASQKKRIENIAAAVRDYLAQQKLTPLEASQHKAVLATRQFLKTLPKKYKTGEKIQALSRQLLATRLGVKVATLDHNKDFETFAKGYCLYNYLAHYGHTLKVEGETIHILQDGKKTPWNGPPDTPAPAYEDNKLPWIYGQEGLQSKDLYNWETLEPYKIDNPDKWGRQYLIEFCACKTDSGLKGILNGTHSWMRLYTPTGEIYSVGLFRPGKGVGCTSNLRTPFRVKQGYLMSPDVSEFWVCKKKTIRKAITEEQFKRIKAGTEKDKANEEELVFQVSGENCVHYTTGLAKKYADIDLPTEESVFRVFMPTRLKRAVDVIPAIIRKICFVVFSILSNLVLILFGAFLVDKKVRAVQNRKKPIKPHISSPLDLFRPSKSMIKHPHTLYERARLVEQWREEEQKNPDSKYPLDELPYLLPPKEYWQKTLT